MGWARRRSIAGFVPVFTEFLATLRALAWDEEVFVGHPKPKDFTLLHLLREGSAWLDIESTPAQEDARDLVALALERTALQVAGTHFRRKWEVTNGVFFEHMMGIGALSGLSRGPLPFPGFDETVLPGGGMPTTHSTSWRVVIDFAKSPPEGFGIYPGGQSGRPLSRYYDMHIAPYLAHESFRLHKPRAAGELKRVSSKVTFYPGGLPSSRQPSRDLRGEAQ